jgi:hypothetical protein
MSANAVVITVHTLDGIFYGAQLIELSTFKHKGDFAVTRTRGNIERITMRDIIPRVRQSGIRDLGKHSLAAFFKICSDCAKFFSHRVAILFWCLAPSNDFPRHGVVINVYIEENLESVRPPFMCNIAYERLKNPAEMAGLCYIY